MIYNPYALLNRKIFNMVERVSPFFYERIFLISWLRFTDLKSKNKMKRKLIKLLQKPLIGDVEIETLNRCNNTCSFCPVNKNIDKRDFHKMDNDLFFSIVNQLKDMNYSGIIRLYGNNEPLLDNRIFAFAKFTREKLPFAKIGIFTNGILLSVNKFENLMESLDFMVIDNYNDELKLNNSVKDVYNFCMKNNLYRTKVEIHLRKKNEILTSRAGQAHNRKRINYCLNSPCEYPFFHMSIRSNGKVSLCNNDARGKITLGDLNIESIVDIWNGTAYSKIRRLLLNGRMGIPLCETCDYLGSILK